MARRRIVLMIVEGTSDANLLQPRIRRTMDRRIASINAAI